jgi:hypothetical protein
LATEPKKGATTSHLDHFKSLNVVNCSLKTRSSSSLFGTGSSCCRSGGVKERRHRG